jgi:hypothetical protein
VRLPIALQAFAREHVADAGKAGLIGVALPQRLDDLEEKRIQLARGA